MENVDVLTPPTFEKSGIVKPRDQALIDGDWLGTFNLWIIQAEPVPAILYQQRTARASLEPLKLDTSVGGHYAAGETLWDGLREAKEEQGRVYQKDEITYLGRRLQVTKNTSGTICHYVVDICFVTDNSPLESYVLEDAEVPAIYTCPLDSIIQLHENGTCFVAQGITQEGMPSQFEVTPQSFPYNWDNYHYKATLLVQRYLAGEKNLLY